MGMLFQIELNLRKAWGRLTHGALRGHGPQRQRLAARWIQGAGVEIGALHFPLALPVGTQVRYVDRMSNQDLLAHYPELSARPIVQVDLIDDGETLQTVVDASQDFLVANHLLEHCEDPIGTLQSWLRVLKTGGVAYLAIPDMAHSFDCRRQPSSWQHLMQDHQGGPQASRADHFQDWCEKVMQLPPEKANITAMRLMQERYSIHFHCWTARSLHDFLDNCQKLAALPFVVADFMRNGNEFIVVLKKQPPLSATRSI